MLVSQRVRVCPQRTLGHFRGRFWSVTTGWGTAAGVWKVKAKVGVKHPASPRTSPTTKNSPAPNVSNASGATVDKHSSTHAEGQGLKLIF